MEKKQSLSQELKGLGQDLARAVKTMIHSEEFQEFQSEIASGVKVIAASIAKSAKAARKSRPAMRLRKRLERVVEAGKEQGKEEAEKAQAAAIKAIRQARQSLTQAVKNRQAARRKKGQQDHLPSQ